VLLTITTTHQPATDLGYLLAKHPQRVQRFNLSFGAAHVFYPHATPESCTAALLLEVDPIALSRGRKSGGAPLAPYVNDRPYAASSFMSVAIAQVFGSALAGRCKEQPVLVDTAIPLRAHLPSLPCRGGESFLRALFEPLDYTVSAERHPLDPTVPEWGDSNYFSVTLTGTLRLRELLGHLYVLVPVLDDQKHYWFGEDELDKLLRHGEGWLADHPARESIARRYLRGRRGLAREALARLTVDEQPDPEIVESAASAEEEAVEAPMRLNDQRLAAVVAQIKASGANRVLDLGCGEGNLVRELLAERQFTFVLGVDVSYRSLEIARERLRFERMSGRQRVRVDLVHGSLTYRDRRLEGFDAAALVEVVEHLDPPRLASLERVVFEHAHPGTVVVTTPNAEYNATWATLPAGRMRHRDHRFEWSRAEFQSWCATIATRCGYSVTFAPIGSEDPRLGPPTQMAVFSTHD
jgi:3' terminal RNA ribose 2'-O-methyltransferase Hen1